MLSGAQLSKALRVPHAPEGSRAENYLLNHDLQPVRRDARAWTAKSYAAFWLADGCNVSASSSRGHMQHD
jgi:cytosine/uracil/thiamine/allantoin permease